jgi:probable F420-dependent oxidoreductase
MSPDALVRIAQGAEAAGFDACSMDDHPFPALGGNRPGWHTFDPFTLLAFVAGATTTLRLHTNIVVLPYRNPFVTAKMAATLQHVSGGRLILGVGAGYLPDEFAALGVSFDDRNELTTRAITAMRQAWSGEPVTAESPGWTAVGNSMLPSATPAPPIWMGGNSRAAMRRAVASCDGWCPFQLPAAYAEPLRTAGLEDLSALAERLVELDRLAGAAQRATPIDVCYVISDPTWLDLPEAELVAQVEELATLGVTWLSITPPAGDAQDIVERLGAFGDQVSSARSA